MSSFCRISFIPLLLVSIICSADGSNVEGVVIQQEPFSDSVGSRAEGVTVVAAQNTPLKGYEYVSATTNSNGEFVLKGLYPGSAYTLTVASKNWSTNIYSRLRSAPEGQTLMLREPFVFTYAYDDEDFLVNVDTGNRRFSVSAEGVISDSRTGLQWYVFEERAIKWVQAEESAAALVIDGGGWELPSTTNLDSIRVEESSVPPKEFPKIRSAWTTVHNKSRALYFSFLRGNTIDSNKFNWNITSLAVRLNPTTEQCRFNLKMIGLQFKMFASEHDGRWPRLDLDARRFAPASTEFMLESKEFFQCPVDAKKTSSEDSISDESYWYLGFALPDLKTATSFFEFFTSAQTERLAEPSVTCNDGTTVYQFHNDLLKRLAPHVNSDEEQDELKAGTPIMIEDPDNHGGFGHVLYMDGHTEFLEYPSRYPMIPEIIESLAKM